MESVRADSIISVALNFADLDLLRGTSDGIKYYTQSSYFSITYERNSILHSKIITEQNGTTGLVGDFT